MLGRHLAIAATLALTATACGQADLSADSSSASTSATLAASTVASNSTGARASGGTVSEASGEAKAPKGAKTAKKVTVKVLPQIVQPGRKTAKASSAKVAVETTVSPKRKTVVTLQVKSGKKWKKLSSAATSSKGKHVFTAALKRGGKAATYRVVVGKTASAEASTAAWAKPSFADEFAGKMNKAWKGQRQHYNPQGLRSCSKGSDKAAKVTGGTLRLSVLKDTSRKDKCNAKRNGKSTGKFAYRLNGNVSTQDRYSFKYGHAAARIKFPRSMGQHGGFWMMPQVHVPNTVDPKKTGAEIDVVESFGQNYSKKHQGMTSFTYHWVMKNGKGTQQKTGGYIKNITSFLNGKNDNWWDAYHVFSVEWTPTQYIFRIDGKETWRSTKGVSGQPQYLALSLLSSDYEISLLKGDKNLPQHMNVDWVRVWETNGN